VLDQNLKKPKRKIVAVLSRLDKRKNLHGLIKAFAMDKKLQAKANLLVWAKTLEGGEEEQKIIKKINTIIRRDNLYQNTALPAIQLEYKKQVPEFYRFLAKRKGIFVNPALIEPFGLTTLEAWACGVPIVVTKRGGPSEIVEHGKTGFLVDPKDPKDIAKHIKKLVRNKALWEEMSKNALKRARKNFSWKACAKKYLQVFERAYKGEQYENYKNK